VTTYFDLYKAVRDGLKEPADLKIHLDIDSDDALEAALLPLRKAKILQTVSVMFGGGRFVECLPDAREEAKAVELARAAGLDLNAAI
jgi:hypothetical protein